MSNPEKIHQHAMQIFTSLCGAVVSTNTSPDEGAKLLNDERAQFLTNKAYHLATIFEGNAEAGFLHRNR